MNFVRTLFAMVSALALAAAVDAYLKSYIDIYPKLGAHWIVVHAGFHFTLVFVPPTGLPR